MIKTIYFDSSATSFPKPAQVLKGAQYAQRFLGGNPGRSGHAMSVRAAEAIYRVREKAALMFGAEPENIVFTQNCTYALNMAVKGIMIKGGHMIISSLEHNSVSRPAFAMCQDKRLGVSVSVAEAGETDEETVANFKRLIRPDTKCVTCMIASNVTGEIFPYREIAELCRTKGICFIGDGAQACGHIDVKLSDGFNIICTSGHKGLYGLSGTGILISDGRFPLTTIIEGGTGATSLEVEQTPFLPEQLESGTLNVPGIVSLGKGIDFVSRIGLNNIHQREQRLCRMFINGLEKQSNIKIIRQKNKKYVPLVSFDIEGVNSAEVTRYLSERGFALRGGYHCSALAHKMLGTEERGLVRFSPSVFNKDIEVNKLLKTIKNFKI